jgi:hypothetical protein
VRRLQQRLAYRNPHSLFCPILLVLECHADAAGIGSSCRTECGSTRVQKQQRHATNGGNRRVGGCPNLNCTQLRCAYLSPESCGATEKALTPLGRHQADILLPAATNVCSATTSRLPAARQRLCCCARVREMARRQAM